jgi:aspartate-semialdehyde dehydrogenase
MKLAVIGVTGMVGKVMLEVLNEEGLNITQLIPVASANSVGKSIQFNDNDIEIVSLETSIELSPDIAIFSAGGSVSEKWAPKFASKGTIVIDNSSFWRMDPSKKLIVPEVNGQILSAFDKIIPNPNCSTIQLVMVLKPLHDRFKIKRVIVSTYQSISGTGVKAVRQMEAERRSIDGEKAYPYRIDRNCIPQCDVFLDNDYTKEEMKLTNETKKIIDSRIEVSATAVRIPVVGGHSEAVNVEFENEYEIEEIKSLLSEMPGLTVQDEPSKLLYPMPINAHGKNDVFVGRIRRDASQPKSLNLWIVADNLRKGAATNAVQIAKLMVGYINN